MQQLVEVAENTTSVGAHIHIVHLSDADHTLGQIKVQLENRG